MTNQTSTSGNSIINSLKRLQRAGSEHSRATEKLFDACERVANFLMRSVPQYVSFGPEVEFIESGYSSWDEKAPTFKAPKYCVSYHRAENDNLYDGTTLRMGDLTIFSGHRQWDRSTALEFATDVANGLLEQAAEVTEMEAVKLRAAQESIAQEAETGIKD